MARTAPTTRLKTTRLRTNHETRQIHPNGPGSCLGGPEPGPGFGIGALGVCSVEAVYPELNQADVPRNTSIIITFKEEVDESQLEFGVSFV